MREVNVYIYVISQGREGPVKIGYATKPRARLQNLQIGNPNELFLEQTYVCSSREAAREIEMELHHQFSNYRIQGEWFSLGVEDAWNYVRGHIFAKDERAQAEKTLAIYLEGLGLL